MEIKRVYDGSDAYLIEAAITTKGLMTNDMADFMPFSTKFDAAYLTAFQAAIDDVLAYGTDETAQDQQAQLTNDVLAALRNCFKKYAQMKFFAEQAFPGNIERQNEFGTNDFQKTRRNQAQMIVFMTALHSVANKYKLQLFEQGATQEQIDEILNLRKQLLETNNEKELFIRSKATATYNRINLLNKLYGYIEKLCSAAQIIFYDNEAKKSAYVYMAGTYEPMRTKSRIAFSGSNLVVKLSFKPNRNITFENTGTVPLIFSLSQTEEPTTQNAITLQPMESQTVKSSLLQESGKYIICTNPTQTNGGYKITYQT